MADLWQNEDPITALEIEVPAWIEQDITPCNVAAIVQGGCASGAYMPAVTYYDARQTMNRHGDAVMQYIEDCLGEIPQPANGESWDGLACHYLSCAVELWAGGVQDEISYRLDEIESEAEEVA